MRVDFAPCLLNLTFVLLNLSTSTKHYCEFLSWICGFADNARRVLVDDVTPAGTFLHLKLALLLSLASTTPREVGSSEAGSE